MIIKLLFIVFYLISFSYINMVTGTKMKTELLIGVLPMAGLALLIMLFMAVVSRFIEALKSLFFGLVILLVVVVIGTLAIGLGGALL